MKVWGRSIYAIENARHEKLETPVTISVPALSTSSLYPFHSMHLVCKAPIFLQYVTLEDIRRYTEARSMLKH